MKKADTKLPKRNENSSDIHLQVLSVDKASNTVYAEINGYHITAVCRAKNNPDVCESVKDILLQSVMD